MRKIICKKSGKLADPYCPKKDRRYEYFKIENYPKEISSYHVKRYGKEKDFKEYIRGKDRGLLRDFLELLPENDTELEEMEIGASESSNETGW